MVTKYVVLQFDVVRIKCYSLFDGADFSIFTTIESFNSETDSL